MVNVQEQMLNLLQIIVGGAISVLGVYISYFVSKEIQLAKEKIKSLQDENERKIINNALDKIDKVISTNVISAENTLKPQILAAIKDNKLDKSELSSLSAIVKNKVLNQLSDDTLDIVNGTISDINDYLENRIETVLADLKDLDGTAVTHTEI